MNIGLVRLSRTVESRLLGTTTNPKEMKILSNVLPQGTLCGLPHQSGGLGAK